MKVSCFYEPIGSVSKDILEIQKLWKHSWAKYDWEPVVVGINEAKKHPEYEFFSNLKLINFSINGKENTRLCYTRWLAYQISGGFWCDYDVMNYGFSPNDLNFSNYQENPVFLSGAGSCGYATEAGYKKIIDTYIEASSRDFDFLKNFVQGNDINDMTIMRFSHSHDWYIEGFCQDYTRDFWEKSKLVHFAHEYTTHPRSALIMLAKNPLI